MQEIKTKKCQKMYLIFFKRFSDYIKYLAGYLISFWSLPRNRFKDLTLKVAWCFNLPWFCMNSCRFGGQFKFSSNKQNLLSECIDIQIQPNLGLGKTSVISRLQSLIQFHDCKVAGCKLIRKGTYFVPKIVLAFIEKKFWDMEIIGNRRKNIISN